MLLPAAAQQADRSPAGPRAEARLSGDPAAADRPPVVRAGLQRLLIVAAGLGVTQLGEELLPKFKETDFLMHWVEKPGVGIEAMNRITIRASEELREIEGVRNFGAHVGRAEAADEVVGPNFTELWISIDEEADYDETVARVQEVVDGYPGLYRDLLTYLTERIKEVLSGASGAIVVRIFGPDLDGLRERADAVRGGDEGRARRDEPEGRTAGARAADRRPLPPRSRGPVRADARRRDRRDQHAGQRHPGGRGVRRAEDLRRGRLGRGVDPLRRRLAAGSADRHALRRSGAAGRRGGHRDRTGPQQHQAGGRQPPDRRDLQRRGPRPRLRRPRRGGGGERR